jgi:hypothetical protein
VLGGIAYIWIHLMKRRARNSDRDSRYDSQTRLRQDDNSTQSQLHRTPSIQSSNDSMDFHDTRAMEVASIQSSLFFGNSEPSYTKAARIQKIKEEAMVETSPGASHLPIQSKLTRSQSIARYGDAIASGKLAPVSLKLNSPEERDSAAYQQSIDSFYGGPR